MLTELNDGLTARGEINLHGGRIGGEFDLTGATVTSPSGRALYADRLVVGESMGTNHGLTTQGEVNLIGTHIAGDLILNGADLSHGDDRTAHGNGRALNADRLTVDRSVFCRDGFTAHGEVDFTNARTGVLCDDRAGWPDVLRLRGFAYDSLENQDVSPRQAAVAAAAPGTLHAGDPAGGRPSSGTRAADLGPGTPSGRGIAERQQGPPMPALRGTPQPGGTGSCSRRRGGCGRTGACARASTAS